MQLTQEYESQAEAWEQRVRDLQNMSRQYDQTEAELLLGATATNVPDGNQLQDKAGNAEAGPGKQSGLLAGSEGPQENQEFRNYSFQATK